MNKIKAAVALMILPVLLTVLVVMLCARAISAEDVVGMMGEGI